MLAMYIYVKYRKLTVDCDVPDKRFVTISGLADVQPSEYIVMERRGEVLCMMIVFICMFSFILCHSEIHAVHRQRVGQIFILFVSQLIFFHSLRN